MEAEAEGRERSAEADDATSCWALCESSLCKLSDLKIFVFGVEKARLWYYERVSRLYKSSVIHRRQSRDKL